MTPVVILARNNVANTLQCAEAVLLSLDVDVSLLVIDNASTDGTAQKLRSQLAFSNRLRVMSLRVVQSVAHCWNLGLDWAFKSADHAVVLNNDIFVRPYTIAALLEYRNRGGVVSCIPVDSIDPIDLFAPIHSTQHPHFSNFLINKYCYDAVGPFDEQFVGAYFEDNDYHIRMVTAGFTGVGLSLPVLHVGSATRKSASPTELRRIDDNYLHNKAYFQSKWGCLPGDDKYKMLTEPDLG